MVDPWLEDGYNVYNNLGSDETLTNKGNRL